MRVLAMIAALFIPGAAAAAERSSGNPDNAPIPSAFAFAKNIPGKVTKIDEGIYTFAHVGGRNVFFVTAKGVIVTDPLNPWAAKMLRDEIRKVTDLPVKYVIYSHSHWDHSAGGQIFRDEGAKFISHEKCVDAFEDFPNPDVVMPDITYRESYTLKLGDRRLKLMYLGPNHSNCMTVIRVVGTPYLIMVDMANPGSVPRSDMTDYSLHNWVRTLREVEAMANDGVTTFIEGHGPPSAPLSAATERREYLEALMTGVKAEMAKGTPADKIADALDMSRFKQMTNFDRYFKENVARVASYYTIGY